MITVGACSYDDHATPEAPCFAIQERPANSAGVEWLGVLNDGALTGGGAGYGACRRASDRRGASELSGLPGDPPVRDGGGVSKCAATPNQDSRASTHRRCCIDGARQIQLGMAKGGSRPARHEFTRETVVAAAADLGDREGCQTLTIPAAAKELGIALPSLHARVLLWRCRGSRKLVAFRQVASPHQGLILSGNR